MEKIEIKQLHLRLKVFALWLFILLNIVFRDIHQMTLKSHLEMLLTGSFNGMEVTDTIMLIGFFVVNIPMSMLLIVLFVKQKQSRILNMIAAVLMPLILLTTPPSDMDDIAHLTIELLAIAAIFWICMKWKKLESPINSSTNGNY